MSERGSRDPDSRATNPGRSERIDAIIVAMETGAWNGADSYQEFATRLGVSPRTIHNDASDAALLLKRANTDDEVRQWADVHLAHIKDLAQTDADYSNARGAIRDRLDARGLLVAKHSVAIHAARNEQELFVAALAEIKADPKRCAEAIAFLSAVESESK